MKLHASMVILSSIIRGANVDFALKTGLWVMPQGVFLHNHTTHLWQDSNSFHLDFVPLTFPLGYLLAWKSVCYNEHYCYCVKSLQFRVNLFKFEFGDGNWRQAESSCRWGWSKTVTRKSSTGGFTFVHWKIDKTPLIYSVSYFNFGARCIVWGFFDYQRPRCDGIGLKWALLPKERSGDSLMAVNSTSNLPFERRSLCHWATSPFKLILFHVKWRC